MFLNNYAKEMGAKAKPTTLPELDWCDLEDTCLNGNTSAGGLDGFAPEDFRLVSDEAFRMLAVLLNLIEFRRRLAH